MTDDYDSGDDFIRRALSTHIDAPADVVPRRKDRMDPIDAVRLLAAAGRTVTVSEPGELIEAADGTLLAVSAPTEQTATLACSPAMLGYTPEELRPYGYNPKGDDNDA